MKIAIVGNSNSGKTTLFNLLTKSNEHTGNWHGVTVDVKEASCVYNNEKFVFYDLPGLSSLKGNTLEEKAAADFLLKGEYDLILNVIEGVRFIPSVSLLEELTHLGKPIICVVNLLNELKKHGGSIDFNVLKNCGLQFYAFELTKKSSRKGLFDALNVAQNPSAACDFNKVRSAFIAPRSIFTPIDRFFTNKYFVFPVFIGILLCAFYLAFGKYSLGGLCSDLISRLFEFIKIWVNVALTAMNVNDFLKGFVITGLLDGFSGLAAFIPSLFVLQFVLTFLEQSGIISRLSFVLDKWLNKFGLNGRAAFSLFMGFGCTAIAVNSCAGLENKKSKDCLILSVPYISCSAKAPVYLFVISRFLRGYGVFLLFFVYMLTLCFCLGFYAVLQRFFKPKHASLVMEIPMLRLNCLKTMLKPLINSIKQFIIKISTVVTISSVLVYLLSSVSLSFEYLSGDRWQESILFSLGNCASVILRPLEIYDAKLGTALLTGVFAKESIVATLNVLNADLSLSVRQAISILVLVALYPPCVVAFWQQKCHIGFKKSLLFWCIQGVVAIFTSYLTYLLLLRPINLLILAGLIISFLLIFRRRKHEDVQKHKKRQTV